MKNTSVVQVYLSWIVNTPILKLLLLGVTVYLLIAGVFMIIYLVVPCSVVVSGCNCTSTSTIDLFELYAFSVITQSTLGYGNIVPGDTGGYVVVIGHLVIGLVFNALFTGILVVRVLVPSPIAIVASPFIAFDPHTNNFSVRLMNRLSLTMFDVTIKVLSVRLKKDSGILNRRPIEMVVNSLSYLETRVPTILRAESGNTTKRKSSTVLSELPALLAPDNLDALSLSGGREYSGVMEIRIIISGQTAIGGAHQILKFDREQMVCGRHKTLYNEKNDSYDLKNFEQISRTNQRKTCSDCQWNNACSLKSPVTREIESED